MFVYNSLNWKRERKKRKSKNDVGRYSTKKKKFVAHISSPVNDYITLERLPLKPRVQILYIQVKVLNLSKFCFLRVLLTRDEDLKFLNNRIPQDSKFVHNANYLKGDLSKLGINCSLQEKLLKKEFNLEEMLEDTWEKEQIFWTLV